MSRKILDAAAAAAFCACLIAASNIPEKKVEAMQTSREESIKEVVFQRNNTAAGFHDEFLGLSFTTESDEKTEIRRNEVILVTSTEEPSFAHKSEETGGDVVEAAAVTAVSNRWNITLTEEEIDLLAKIVWLEANGEPVEGQQAVVEVVLNRMASELYPNTLYDVLSQKNPVQFCSWKNRDYAEPTEKEYQSIRQVLYGNTSILRNDTLYFSTKPLTSHTDVRIGGHSFCY